jgi:hypothetical protein
MLIMVVVAVAAVVILAEAVEDIRTLLLSLQPRP